MSTLRRVLWVGALAALPVLLAAAPSFADTADPSGVQEIVDSLQDSHGNAVDEYMTLSLYDGGLTGGLSKLYAFIASLSWTGYAFFVQIQILILNWILSLGWMPFVVGPITSLGNVMQTVMGTLGIRPLMITVLGFTVAFLLLRRRTGTAISELIVGCTIAALGVTILANPVATIAGQNGALTQAQEVGMTLSTAITSSGENLTPGDNGAEMRNGLTESMVDSLLRTPHQIINYGQVLDGGPCEETYNESLGTQDARIAMGGCDPALQEVADNAGPLTVWNVGRLWPALSYFGLFTLAIAVLTLGAVGMGAWYAVKLIWDLVLGIGSGATRTAAIRSLVGVGVSLAFIALILPLVTVYMMVLSSVTGTVGGPVAALFRFDIVSIIMTLGVVVVWTLWARLRKSGQTLAEKLSQLGRASNAPAPHSVSPLSRATGLLRDGAQIASSIAQISSARSNRSVADAVKKPAEDIGDITPTRTVLTRTGKGTPVKDGAPTLESRSERLQLTAGPGGEGKASGTPDILPPGQPAGPTASDRLKERLKTGAKKTVRTGIELGALVGTGGASGAVTGSRAAFAAGKAAKVARGAGKFKEAAHVVRDGAHRLQAPRSPRNEALRARLREVSHVREGKSVVDASTGRRYSSSTTRAGVEILSPVRETSTRSTSSGEAASRLRERLQQERQRRSS